MHHVVQRPAQPSQARWHLACEEPWAEDAIEVDVGDFRVWRGVRFAREVETFVDEETGVAVPVVMWRYAERH